MTAIEIARRLAKLEQRAEACKAYTLAIHENNGVDPAQDLEAAVYILQYGGDYKISYTCFRDLYNRGFFREEILPLMTAAFYEPNIKLLKTRYEKNCKLLSRYPYLFRKDFVPFEELAVKFFPYDDNGFIPYYVDEDRFGEYINFKHPVVSRNFFKDLEKPILADDVYSQYEIEYLCDNVRDSQYVGRENHVYLHYTDWGAFCSRLQCLNLRAALLSQKLVFLVEDEIEQYPIDFKERFGMDYSQYPVRPVGVAEVTRMIWHTQLSTHNGGDFFNEIFDAHPNLLCMPSLMFSDIEENVKKIRDAYNEAHSLQEALQLLPGWPRRITEELYWMKSFTDKDILVGMFLADERAAGRMDPNSRIAPAFFFQPHFHNIVYQLNLDGKGCAQLYSEQYEQVRKSPLFRGFKYIKTFTPMRRFTTSHGATVKFMYYSSLGAHEAGEEKKTVVSDAVSERILNRSFMVDWQDRLYIDSVLVRFEDGKLNPTATFRALAAFVDLPYTESMTYCSEYGNAEYGIEEGVDERFKRITGFNPETIYRTYDEYVNGSERKYIEYFLRDAYAYYGYDCQYYDGSPVDEETIKAWVADFERMNHYIRETWKFVYQEAKVSENGQRVSEEVERTVQEKLLDNHVAGFEKNRLRNAEILQKGLRFVNRNGQPLRMMPKLELDPALLEQPLYH